MQKKYALLHKVLRCFDKAGALEELILVGSWCMYFYKDYFSTKSYRPSIRTKDIDFVVPLPIKSKTKMDVAESLKREGFITTFNNRGYMRLEPPEIIIEFLVPERGRGIDRPYPLPHLGVNAQALRFLDFLVENTIIIASEGFNIRIPHPAAFGLHKLLISKRRKTEEKFIKERQEALKVLGTLIEQKESNGINIMFDKMPFAWRKKVFDVLKEAKREDILNILQ